MVIEDDDLRLLVALGLEHMREHGGALIRPGRAAIGIGRRDHHDQRAVVERIEPLHQQLGLRAGLPGMRHGLRRRFRIAGHRIPLEVDAGRDHQPVIGDALLADHDLLLVAVDGARARRHDAHALLAHLVVVVGDRLERAVAADIEVREEAGREVADRLDHGDVDRTGRVLVDEARDRAAAWAAAEHDQLGLGFGLSQDGGREQRRRRAPPAMRRQGA